MANKMTKAKSITPADQRAELKQLSQAMKDKIPPAESLRLEGVPTGQPAIVAYLDGALVRFGAADELLHAYRKAVVDRDAHAVEVREICKSLRAAVKQYFGGSSPMLASFGIATDKPIERTSKDNLVAFAKGQQTRGVRGTMGKRQKERVKVVSDPEVHVASDGTVTADLPRVNLPAPADGSSPAPAGNGAPPTGNAVAPAGSGPGSGGPNGNGTK